MRTKFIVTFTVYSDESLTSAEKREIKEVLKDKANRIRIRGYELAVGAVKTVPAPKRRLEEEAEAEVTEPKRRTRRPRVEEEEAEVTEPKRRPKRRPVVRDLDDDFDFEDE